MKYMQPIPKGDIVIGQRIRELRTERGMTQKKLAEHVAVSPSSITRLENGQIMVSVFTILEIAKALKVSVAYILCGTDQADFEIAELTELAESLKQCSPSQRRALLYNFEHIVKVCLKGGGEKEISKQ